MQPPAGEPLLLVGTFREVIPPERLVYTWRWEAGVPESRELPVVVEFPDHGDETEVVLIHEDLPAGPSLDRRRDGGS